MRKAYNGERVEAAVDGYAAVLARGVYSSPTLLHMDIKPANIIYNPQTESVSVIDFEFARFGDLDHGWVQMLLSGINLGAETTRGDYFFFCDTDTCVAPQSHTALANTLVGDGVGYAAAKLFDMGMQHLLEFGITSSYYNFSWLPAPLSERIYFSPWVDSTQMSITDLSPPQSKAQPLIGYGVGICLFRLLLLKEVIIQISSFHYT